MSVCIGIVLDDDKTTICQNDESSLETFPTALCWDKQTQSWQLGAQAKERALADGGMVVEQLLQFRKKKGTATVGTQRYSAQQLLNCFFEKLLSGKEADSVVVSLRTPERVLMQAVRSAVEEAGIAPERIQVTSHSESFVEYVLAQDRTLSNQTVGMFELSEHCLCYYEMKLTRTGRRRIDVSVQPQKETIELETLKTDAGAKAADELLANLAERMLGKRGFSAIFLCGVGFSEVDFAASFMAVICSRRRVCAEVNLLALGAALRAQVLAGVHEALDATIICDTTVRAGIGLKVIVNEKEQVLPLIAAGDAWFSAEGCAEAILDGQDYVELTVSPVDQMRRMNVRVTLEGFPKRPNRTTKLRICTSFSDANRLQIRVEDRGFGELFPASGAVVNEELRL